MSHLLHLIFIHLQHFYLDLHLEFDHHLNFSNPHHHHHHNHNHSGFLCALILPYLLASEQLSTRKPLFVLLFSISSFIVIIVVNVVILMNITIVVIVNLSSL